MLNLTQLDFIAPKVQDTDDEHLRIVGFDCCAYPVVESQHSPVQTKQITFQLVSFHLGWIGGLGTKKFGRTEGYLPTPLYRGPPF